MFTVFTIGQAQAQACPGQAHTRPNLMSVGGFGFFSLLLIFSLLRISAETSIWGQGQAQGLCLQEAFFIFFTLAFSLLAPELRK